MSELLTLWAAKVYLSFSAAGQAEDAAWYSTDSTVAL